MVNFYLFFLSVSMVFVLVSYVLNRNHVLMMLISLEFVGLVIFFFCYLKMVVLIEEQYFLMVYLSFCVCEGVIGLSLLVGMIRSHGSDFISSLSLLKC
uniref:NADH-ubiquinone oxidoreductase chain 4L n=1 Tax=Lepinotus reticulatus TaxID=209981 RepID=A0A3Q8MA81_9NEOP|nr:NADH dehydrogenase subunit 4L [Lepinotus reticulatus]